MFADFGRRGSGYPSVFHVVVRGHSTQFLVGGQFCGDPDIGEPFRDHVLDGYPVVGIGGVGVQGRHQSGDQGPVGIVVLVAGFHGHVEVVTYTPIREGLDSRGTTYVPLKVHPLSICQLSLALVLIDGGSTGLASGLRKPGKRCLGLRLSTEEDITRMILT